MLRGIPVGDIKGSLQEAALLQALEYEETLNHIRTLIGFKGAKLDNGDPSSVQDFNKLLKLYDEIRNPHTVEEREQAVKKASKQLEELSSFSLKGIKLKKGPKGEIAEHKHIKKIV